jgi:acyl-CoA dehydrogenase
MSLARKRCAPSTYDLPFFFESGHHELAEQARHLALRTFGPEEEHHAASGPAPYEELGERCRVLARELSAGRLLEAVVPAAYGGLPMGRHDTIDVRAVCLVREVLGWASGLAEYVFAMQGLGSYPIVLAGTDAQRNEFLPPVLAGTSLAAFAITEEEAGSDVASMRTRARREGDHYVLDGAKTFISNAGIAGHYVVFAKTALEAGSRGISAFVVRPDDPGFVFAGPLPLIAEHPIGTIRFEGMRIPASRRLGAEGEGFRIAMGTLDVFRSTVGAAALGMARRALDEALTRTTSRRQFGQAIADFQSTQGYLAEMATELDAARLLVYRAAYVKDQGSERVALEASMGKMFATEAAQRIIDRALQLHGGLGVVRGVAVERLYREIRALRIYEGTTEIQRVVIARLLIAGEKARAAEAATLAGELAESLREPPPSTPPPPSGGADETKRWRSVRPPKE